MKKCTVAVIGAGASGLLAAAAAAGFGAEVTVYEHRQEAGLKLLMTGNGKCNFTNLRMGSEFYHTSSPDKSIIESVLDAFSVEDTLNFFESIGMLSYEKDGYFYPASGQARTVRDVLLRECRLRKVHMVFGAQVYESIRKTEDGRFAVGKKIFDRLILACGGKSERQTGSDGSGYEIAKKFGHTVRALHPALVPLYTDTQGFAQMAGVRVRAIVRLIVDGNILTSESGELQLTAQGISGIPAFQISSQAVRALREQKKTEAEIDFLCGRDPHKICGMISRMLQNGSVCPEHREGAPPTVQGDAYLPYLTGLVNGKILQYLLSRMQNIRPHEISRRLTQELCAHRITLTGYANLNHAQVTGGGIPFEEVTSRLESAICRGLYFAGEMLDADGICGGYNLQWAWSSGYAAASGAAGMERKPL